MKSALIVSIFVVTVAVVFIALTVTAYNVGSYSKTFSFSYATESLTNNANGVVVFHLSNGNQLSFTNAFTRENVSLQEMKQGGSIVVSYSFIGYPVQVDYIV